MDQHALQDARATEWPPGKVIGEKYILVEKIGDEGVVSVYRAGTAGAEPRLVRALSADLADDPALAHEFKEITDLLRGVTHPNLPAIEAAGEAQGRPFLVTQTEEGRTLADLMRDEGPLDPARVCFIARQIAAALETLHRLGVLHLGLDPRYIMIRGDAGEERVTLQGIGGAQVRMSQIRHQMSGTSRVGRRLTLADLIPAAPAYCAPEAALARSPEALDGRADLYSLGVLTYQLLAGRLPVSVEAPDDDGLATLVAQADPPEAPLEFDDNLPEPLVRLVRQLVERRRELRPSTAKVVKQWFDLVARRLRMAGVPAGKSHTPVSSRERQTPTAARPVIQTLSLAGPKPAGARDASAVPAASQEPELEPEPSPAAVAAVVEVESPLQTPVLDSMPGPAAGPVPESVAAPEPELIPQPLAEQVPVSQPPAESKPADAFAEVHLEAPPAAGAGELIVLRPGGRVIAQEPAPAGPLVVPGEAAPNLTAFGSSTSVLFKTQSPPQPPAGWGRRALAALVVVVVGAAALFFIGESRKLQWGSMTPTKVDQEHSLSRPDANAEVPQPATPSNTAPAAAPPPSPPQPQSALPAQTQPAASLPASNSARIAAAAPGDTAAPLSPLQDELKPAARTQSKPPADAAAAQIRSAVAAGDVFYKTGQYDLAIQTYEGPLKDYPGNELLRSRIERARKAKAAEQEYLGQ